MNIFKTVFHTSEGQKNYRGMLFLWFLWYRSIATCTPTGSSAVGYPSLHC